MIDGDLVAVESNGQAEEIRARAERIKAEQQEAARQKEKKRQAVPEEITADSKARVLRDGLFSTRRKMFQEAVRNYL